MHLEYRITLPDHDWVVAAKHKLIPSVVEAVVINDDKFGRPDAVGYSGPTYVAVRSGKHSSSTAETHARDFDRLLELPCFDEIMKGKLNDRTALVFLYTKPILYVSNLLFYVCQSMGK